MSKSKDGACASWISDPDPFNEPPKPEPSDPFNEPEPERRTRSTSLSRSWARGRLQGSRAVTLRTLRAVHRPPRGVA